MPNKISAALIVKNEEVMLGQCLESIKEVDEIVVVDTGSKDNTINIAMNFGAKVFEDYKWNDNFAEARNHANSKCTGDWILIIDADEILEPGGVEKIRKEIAKTKFNSLDFIVHGGKTCFDSTRVIKNTKKIFWKGAIHNHLSIAEKNKTDIKIKFGYSPAHKDDPNRALRILKSEVKKNPQASREIFYLGREYTYKRDWPNAIYWLEYYVKMDTWAPEKAHAHLLLAKAKYYMGQIDGAKDACLQAMKINANFKEVIELLAHISGPSNKERWLKFAETANNKDVLFRKQENLQNSELEKKAEK